MFKKCDDVVEVEKGVEVVVFAGNVVVVLIFALCIMQHPLNK